eukprot:COSAG03_NODE_873_length_5533_cov_76.535149_6_plen_188_part_00
MTAGTLHGGEHPHLGAARSRQRCDCWGGHARRRCIRGILDAQGFGVCDAATGSPMPVDALFWVASMSKPVTGTAAMLLVDEGLLDLDKPIAAYLPEWTDQNDDRAGKRSPRRNNCPGETTTSTDHPRRPFTHSGAANGRAARAHEVTSPQLCHHHRQVQPGARCQRVRAYALGNTTRFHLLILQCRD